MKRRRPRSLNRTRAELRAPLTFINRFGPSVMPLEISARQDEVHGDLVVVHDPEDGLIVSYAYEGRLRLAQVTGPKGRG